MVCFTLQPLRSQDIGLLDTLRPWSGLPDGLFPSGFRVDTWVGMIRLCKAVLIKLIILPYVPTKWAGDQSQQQDLRVEHLLKDFFCRFYLSFRAVLIGTPRHETSQQNSEYRSGNFSIKIRRNDTLRFECLKWSQWQPILRPERPYDRSNTGILSSNSASLHGCMSAFYWFFCRV
jgi:hypothetical protein